MEQIGSLNFFLDNRLDNSTSALADVFFDVNAENNLLIGKCKTLIDLGVGNSSTCGEPLALAAQTFSSSAAVPKNPSTTLANTAMQSKRQAILQGLTVMRQLKSDGALPLGSKIVF